MKIAVSSCLLGNNVRYDGDNKHNDIILYELSKQFDFIPFCPEDIAFGTPRESIRILFNDAQQKIITSNKLQQDLTLELSQAITVELNRLSKEPICGVIFKSKSPSCGLSSAVIENNGTMEENQDGLFAASVKNIYPLLPMIEESDLIDEQLKNQFISLAITYHKGLLY